MVSIPKRITLMFAALALAVVAQPSWSAAPKFDITTTLRAAFVFSITARVIAQPQWAQSGHDARHTGRSPFIGTKVVALLWSYAGGELGPSPAIGADGTVFIGSSDNSIYALDGATGALIWSCTTGGGPSSPAIGADGTVYIGSYDFNVYALNGATGAVIWSYTTGGYVYSSPAIGADDTVYIGSNDNKVYALNGTTGGFKWSYTTGGWVTTSPAIGVDGTVYVGSDDSKVYALNGATGALSWNFTIGEVGSSSPAIGADGAVYIGGAEKVYALSGATGALIWNYTTGGYVYSTPAIGADGMVYIGSGDKVYALSGATGALIWSYATGGIVYTSPAIGADGTVYIGSGDKNVYALNGTTGALTWSYTTGVEIYSSPAIGADGTVYIGSYESFYALNAPTRTGTPSTSPTATVTPTTSPTTTPLPSATPLPPNGCPPSNAVLSQLRGTAPSGLTVTGASPATAPELTGLSSLLIDGNGAYLTTSAGTTTAFCFASAVSAGDTYGGYLLRTAPATNGAVPAACAYISIVWGGSEWGVLWAVSLTSSCPVCSGSSYCATIGPYLPSISATGPPACSVPPFLFVPPFLQGAANGVQAVLDVTSSDVAMYNTTTGIWRNYCFAASVQLWPSDVFLVALQGTPNCANFTLGHAGFSLSMFCSTSCAVGGTGSGARGAYCNNNTFGAFLPSRHDASVLSTTIVVHATLLVNGSSGRRLQASPLQQTAVSASLVSSLSSYTGIAPVGITLTIVPQGFVLSLWTWPAASGPTSAAVVASLLDTTDFSVAVAAPLAAVLASIAGESASAYAPVIDSSSLSLSDASGASIPTIFPSPSPMPSQTMLAPSSSGSTATASPASAQSVASRTTPVATPSPAASFSATLTPTPLPMPITVYLTLMVHGIDASTAVDASVWGALRQSLGCNLTAAGIQWVSLVSIADLETGAVSSYASTGTINAVAPNAASCSSRRLLRVSTVAVPILRQLTDSTGVGATYIITITVPPSALTPGMTAQEVLAAEQAVVASILSDFATSGADITSLIGRAFIDASAAAAAVLPSTITVSTAAAAYVTVASPAPVPAANNNIAIIAGSVVGGVAAICVVCALVYSSRRSGTTIKKNDAAPPIANPDAGAAFAGSNPMKSPPATRTVAAGGQDDQHDDPMQVSSRVAGEGV